MSDMLNLTNTASALSPSESQTDTLTERRYSLTCVSLSSPVQPNSIEELRMWLVAAFPASHSALPEGKRAQTMPEICGLQQPTLFAQSDLPAFSWKTYRDYSNSTTVKAFSLTLPKWGIWDATGLYPLPTAVLDTDGNDCGSLDDLVTIGTPTAAMTARSPAFKRGVLNPQEIVNEMKNWPSPTCPDVCTGNLKSTQQKPGSMHSVTLPQAVAMWPTPDANMGARGTQPEWKPVRDSGHTATYTINQAVRDMYPTPTAHLAKETGAASEYDRNEPTLSSRMFESPEQRNGMALNPDWVEWLMGWPVGWSDIKPLATLNWRDWQTDPADACEAPRFVSNKKKSGVDLATSRFTCLSCGRKYGINDYERNPTCPNCGSMSCDDALDIIDFDEKDDAPSQIIKGEVPRVTDVKENRANRLKAIGNGQVPQCVVKAWELL